MTPNDLRLIADVCERYNLRLFGIEHFFKNYKVRLTGRIAVMLEYHDLMYTDGPGWQATIAGRRADAPTPSAAIEALLAHIAALAKETP